MSYLVYVLVMFTNLLPCTTSPVIGIMKVLIGLLVFFIPPVKDYQLALLFKVFGACFIYIERPLIIEYVACISYIYLMLIQSYVFP